MNDNKRWKTSCNRFVAFLDIAGFKYFRKNHKTCEVEEMLLKIRDATDLQNRHFKPYKSLYIINISDSIIVFSKDDSAESFACFSHFIGAIFNQILLEYRLLNGAIAYGDIYVGRRKMIFFGEAYEKAYELQNKMNYYGIACDDSIDNYFSVSDMKQNPDYYDSYHRLYVEVKSYLKKEDSPCKLLNFLWYESNLFDYTPNEWCGSYWQRINGSIDSLNSEIAEMNEDDCKKIETKISNTKKCCDEMFALQFPKSFQR